MGKLADTTPLNEISIPGTHDSASIKVDAGVNYINPFICQNCSIEDQLYGGVRALDIRLMTTDKHEGSLVGAVLEDASRAVVSELAGAMFGDGIRGAIAKTDTITVYTCHGKLGLGTAQNVFERFSSVLSVCKEFLRTFPSETIVMTLKVDDPDGEFSKKKRDAITACLENIPVYRSEKMPTLKEVRGKIWLLNRIDDTTDFGAPLEGDWVDDTTGKMLPRKSRREFDVYLQDNYDSNVTKGKLGLFTAVYPLDKKNPLIINFASAVTSLMNLKMVYINDDVVPWLVETKPKKLGICFFNFALEYYVDSKWSGPKTITDLIVASNFDYSGL
jgi:1-phosphatidylinositol phosphodiesterase